MDSLACNVVILPSEDVAHRAIQLSTELAAKGVHFTLKDGALFPHVSVYMLQLKYAGLDEVEKRLAEIANVVPVLELSVTRYEQSKQFFDAEYEKPEVLSQLQKQVVTTLNPIRDGMRARDVERMKEATGLALENFKNYGWNTIGELYRPHLTITRFLEDQDVSSLSLPPVQEFSGVFTKLGLFEMGDNGTCVRKIAEFELSGR